MCSPILKALLVIALGTLQAHAASSDYFLYGYFFSSNVQDVMALSPQFCALRFDFLNANVSNSVSIYNAPGGFAERVADTNFSQGPLNQILFNSSIYHTFSGPGAINTAFYDTATAEASGTTDFGKIHLLIITLYHVRGKIMFDFLDQAVLADQPFDSVQGLDKAWATLSGSPEVSIVNHSNPKACPDAMHTIFELTPAGLSYHGMSEANLLMGLLFNQAKAAALNSFADPTAADTLLSFTLRIAQLYGEFGLTYLRHSAFSIDLGWACGNHVIPAVAASNNKLIWPMVKALIWSAGATEQNLEALDVLIQQSSGFNLISASIRYLISTTSIQMSDLGVPVRDAVISGWAQNGPGSDMLGCTAHVPLE